MPYCTECGAKLDDSNKYCTVCGTKIGKATGEATVPPPRQPVGSPAPVSFKLFYILTGGVAGIVLIGIILYFALFSSPNGNVIQTVPVPGITVITPHRTLPATPESTLPAPEITSIASPVATVTPHDGMFTYIDSEHRFAIDYPEDWTVNNTTNLVSFSPAKEPVLHIGMASKSGSLQDYFTARSKAVLADSVVRVISHDYKFPLGYRFDYSVGIKDSTRRTKTTEIIVEGQDRSQVFLITFSGTDTYYDDNMGDFTRMIGTFRLL